MPTKTRGVTFSGVRSGSCKEEVNKKPTRPLEAVEFNMLQTLFEIVVS